ncbi:flagellar motor protein MotB [Myxococcus llanfairpwllgwyngyllgogerychwyrndrobwllllantysiliogogogochensis]|uniref:Flagellar motor protein MotB n=1 Tax=Myxococcus llanfairpwllgwyngyllgogerychwyrndrobwllllantysiliogogogochensis TaxID=2590453 RepID=A0A540WNQ5_9BACT|nr:flagellar motor protein MotB [Myxococcus llanfairpwllgwyngyllgogerychwyrndrobwllllantysiliogogogochensis]
MTAEGVVVSFRPAVALLSALFSVVLALPASAQSAALPTFNLQRLELDPAGLGSLVVSTGRTLPAGMVRVAVQGHYEQLPFHFQTRWEPGGGMGLVENKFTMDVTAAIGVLDWLQVDAEVPFIVTQGGTTFMDVNPPEGQGLGSPWLGARAALVRPAFGFQLAVDLSAALPVGSKELLARDTYAVHPSLQLGFLAETWQLGAEVGVFLREKKNLMALSAESADVIGNELRLAGTVTSRAGELTRGEVSLLLGVPLQGGRTGAELMVAIRRHTTSWMDLYVMGGPGVGAGLDTPTFRFLAGASFSTSRVD